MQDKNIQNNLLNKSTRKIALMGVLTGIIFLQSFVPFLGLIPIPAFNITIIHITVIIGAIMLGPTSGAVLGLVWGILTMFRAFFMPTTPIDPIVFTNPIISVLPRILIGVFSGYTFKFISLFDKTKIVAAIGAGVVGSFTNTILVLGLIYLIYKEPYANFYNMDVSALLPALLVVVGTNGVIEAIAAGIITPIISKALFVTYGK